MSKLFLQAVHSNESRSWSSFFGVVQIRRIVLPQFGQPGRSATLSGNATVMKGTIAPERETSLYVPRVYNPRHFQSRSCLDKCIGARRAAGPSERL
jgi:hypothetical protein